MMTVLYIILGIIVYILLNVYVISYILKYFVVLSKKYFDWDYMISWIDGNCKYHTNSIYGPITLKSIHDHKYEIDYRLFDKDTEEVATISTFGVFLIVPVILQIFLKLTLLLLYFIIVKILNGIRYIYNHNESIFDFIFGMIGNIFYYCIIIPIKYIYKGIKIVFNFIVNIKLG